MTLSTPIINHKYIFLNLKDTIIVSSSKCDKEDLKKCEPIFHLTQINERFPICMKNGWAK